MALILNLISRPDALRTLREARALLAEETPMSFNCGKLCGAACCQGDETGENGMLLFPFEDALYSRPIPDFKFHLADDDTLYRGGKRLVCDGYCPREHRPLACRLFPLRIRVHTDARGTRAIPETDPRAWSCCPILERGGLRGMSQSFVEAVRQAGDLLIGNVFMLEALLNEQRFLDETRTL